MERESKIKVYPFYFLIPALVIYTVLFIIPSFIGFGFSLTNWNSMGSAMKFIGLDNFKEIFISNKTYMLFILNTLIFAVVTTIMKNIVGLLLALFFNEGLKTKQLLRTVFFLPVALSPLIIGLIFVSILNPVTGLLNSTLRVIGVGILEQQWLVDPKTAMLSVIGVEVWRLAGFNMAIYLAGLQMIPKSFYESASIDGAGVWRKFINITFPYLLPAITINMILNLIQGLKVFDLIYVLTKGGPGNTTGVLNTAVFEEFSSGRYGMGTAVGVVIFLLTSLTAYSALKLMRRGEAEVL
ncbi:MAG: ABC transporter permease [Clostridiales bacterium GWC2_40_7]|nr:MAG: ABC transporter permease [Clostridiales bacterium GWC2_40_7]